jgi:hypothetical protein
MCLALTYVPMCSTHLAVETHSTPKPAMNTIHFAICAHCLILRQLNRLMKITEHIAQAKDTLISFEVLPPLKGKTISSLYDHLDALMEFKPAWINVTYHRSESMF